MKGTYLRTWADLDFNFQQNLLLLRDLYLSEYYTLYMNSTPYLKLCVCEIHPSIKYLMSYPLRGGSPAYSVDQILKRTLPYKNDLFMF